MINVYALDCRPYLDEARTTDALPLLDATRCSRALRLQNSQKKAQLIAAGVLLYRLFGKDGQPPRLTHGSRGKPYLVDSAAFFSLSHTDEWVFCAVADSEVGLDAQIVAPSHDKIVERWFTPSEKTWLAADPDERFTALWTRKEAYTKLTGFGLVLPMSSFTVPTADGWDEENHCYWKSYDFPTEGTPIHIAVCCSKEDAFSEIRVIE